MKTTVQLVSQSVPTPTRECVKVVRMWPLEADVGSCGSAIVHIAVDCWTFPVAVPTQIVGADGLMLVHGAPLARYTPLDMLSTMEVSIKVSEVAKVGCGCGVGIGAGIHRLSLALRTTLATLHCQASQPAKSLHPPIRLVLVSSRLCCGPDLLQKPISRYLPTW